MKAKEEYLLHMKSHPYFQMFLDELRKSRPPIPHHNPMSDNTEEWKSFSAQQKGFDLCCSIFNITLE